MKFDVFISYSRKDFDEVSSILEFLKTSIPGLTYWFDIDGIESGDEFQDKIISAIDNSAYVLFALSENSISSEWAKDEVMYAKNTDKKIIPLLLKGAEMKGWFLFKFGRIDCIDTTSSLQMEKLIQNMSSWLGKASASDDPVSPERQVSPPSPTHSKATHESLCPCGSPSVDNQIHGECIWRVGDYYEVNGKEGVVFWVDGTGKHGKIVSMREVSRQWCDHDEYAKRISTGAIDQTDGASNQNIICSTYAYFGSYPAMEWCRDLGAGWYLPAIEELRELLSIDSVYMKVNVGLLKNSGDLLSEKRTDTLYWSSTEAKVSIYASLYNMRDGKTVDFYKHETHRVRAVAIF